MLLVLLAGCPAADDSPTDSAPPSETTTETGTDSATPDTDSGSPPPKGTPRLVVNGGYGGGTYEAGTLVPVWADVDPQRQIVTGWSGDTDVLDTSTEWNTGLVMPDHDVTITASIEDADWAPDERVYDLEGRQRDAWVIEASNAQGIAMFFHGGAYAIDQLRSNAGSTLVMQLVQANWTVVGVQSEAEAAAGVGGWSTALNLTTNTDLRNVNALKAALLADGTADKGEPWVAIGKSAGAMFANAVGAMGLADAVVSYCAAGSSDANTLTMAPTAWYLAAEDTTFPNAPKDAADFQKVLKGRGLSTDYYVHPTSPLYDQRFERITGIDAATSADLANRLREIGAVNANGQWTDSGVAIFGALDLPNGLSAAQITAIGAEIEIMAADHELYDDVAGRMVGWLDTTL